MCSTTNQVFTIPFCTKRKINNQYPKGFCLTYFEKKYLLKPVSSVQSCHCDSLVIFQTTAIRLRREKSRYAPGFEPGLSL